MVTLPAPSAVGCDSPTGGTRPLDIPPNPFYITFVPETPPDESCMPRRDRWF